MSKQGGVLIDTKSHFDTNPLVITSAPNGSAVACTLNNDNGKLLLVCSLTSLLSPNFFNAYKVIDILEEIFNLVKLHDYVLVGDVINLQDVDWTYEGQRTITIN